MATALLFSTGSTVVKATAFSAWQVGSLRCGVAVLTLGLLMPSARRGWSGRTWLVGCAYASTMVLYVLSNKLTTAANAIFLQATAPLYVLALSRVLLGERIRGRDLAFMAALAAGIGAVFLGVEEPSRSAAHPALGNLLGAVTGLAWGLTILGLRWLESTPEADASEARRAVLAGNLIAFLALLPLALPAAGTALDWAAVLYLGAVQIGLAYWLMTAALRRVPAFEASLLLLIEPVFSPLWAWLVHYEVPAGWSLLGCAVILLATLARTVLPLRSAALRATGAGGSR